MFFIATCLAKNPARFFTYIKTKKIVFLTWVKRKLLIHFNLQLLKPKIWLYQIVPSPFSPFIHKIDVLFFAVIKWVYHTPWLIFVEVVLKERVKYFPKSLTTLAFYLSSFQSRLLLKFLVSSFKNSYSGKVSLHIWIINCDLRKK